MKNKIEKIVTFIILTISSGNTFYLVYNSVLASFRTNENPDPNLQLKYSNAWQNLDMYGDICHLIGLVCLAIAIILLIWAISKKNKNYIILNILNIIISLIGFKGVI